MVREGRYRFTTSQSDRAGASLHFEGDSRPTTVARTLIALEYRYNVGVVVNKLRTAAEGTSPFKGINLALMRGLPEVIQEHLEEPMEVTNDALAELLSPQEQMQVLFIQHTGSFDIGFEGLGDAVREVRESVTPTGRAGRAEQLRHQKKVNALDEDSQGQANAHARRMNSMEAAHSEVDLHTKVLDLRERQLDVAAKERQHILETIAAFNIAGLPIDAELAAALKTALLRTASLEATDVTKLYTSNDQAPPALTEDASGQ